MLGLHSLLDDANTGDIRLVCLEREIGPDPLHASDSGLGFAEHNSTSNRYRRRVLYAHTSIIKLRSEYLDDWIRFSSDERGVSGRGGSNGGDRAVNSVICLDVDFVTMYWFLHFLYTGELEFKTVEDLTNTAAFSVESLDRDIAEQLVSDLAEGSSWDWRTLVADADGSMRIEFERDQASAANSPASRQGASTSSQQVPPFASAPKATSQGQTTRTAAGVRSSSKTRQDNSVTPRPSSASSTATLQVAPISRTLSSPTSWKQTTPPRTPPSLDPHIHPTGPVPPASAFAIYALAHRYQLDELARLAQNHLLGRLKPAAACSLLLASFRFKDLHHAVEDFVISHWEEVQSSVRSFGIAIFLTLWI